MMREKIEDMTALAAALREIADRVAPIPADARAVVREALEAADAFWAAHHHAVTPALNSPWYKVRAAIEALDAAPAEPKTVGYGVISKNGKTLGRDAAYALAQSGDRIVRLVAEDE